MVCSYNFPFKVIMKQHRTILVLSIPVIMAVRATITMDTRDIIARALVDILVVTATVITVCKMLIFLMHLICN